MMIRNKYLDDLGIKRKHYASNFVKGNKVQRFIERRKYGFDHRETVNMDLIFAEWLYSRLMMLMEQTMDDLTFHSIEFEGTTYTIEQAFLCILAAAKKYIRYNEMIWEDRAGLCEENEEQIYSEMKAATRLWAEVMCFADRVVVSKRMLHRLEKDDGDNFKLVGDEFVKIEKRT